MAGITDAQFTARMNEIFGEHGENVRVPAMKVREFHGKDYEDPDEWIERFEHAVRSNGWPDNRRFEIASANLRGAAMDWYNDDQANITRWGDHDNGFKRRFLNRFRTQQKIDVWQDQFLGIKQKNETLGAYKARYREALRRAQRGNNNNLPQRIRVRTFINGLESKKLREMVRMRMPTNLEEAMQAADVGVDAIDEDREYRDSEDEQEKPKGKRK